MKNNEITYDIKEEQDNLKNECTKSEFWCDYLVEEFGEMPALWFAAGCECFLDEIDEDIEKLRSMPFGSHLGQLECSHIIFYLPERFTIYYDWDFMFALKSSMYAILERIKKRKRNVVLNVLDQIALYAIIGEAKAFAEGNLIDSDPDDIEEWMYELGVDENVLFALYDSGKFISPENPMHIVRWYDTDETNYRLTQNGFNS